MSKTPDLSFVNTSADDLKSSLFHISDVARLEAALQIVTERGEKSKAQHIKTRIRAIKKTVSAVPVGDSGQPTKAILAPGGPQAPDKPTKAATGKLSIGSALAAVPLDTLVVAQRNIGAVQERVDGLSGIFATLRGVALVEVKSRLKHGEWQPWLKEHFPQSDRNARRLIMIGQAFLEEATSRRAKAAQILKAGSNDQISSALATVADAKFSGEASLDFSHPLLGAIAAFVAGRSSYQLIVEVGALAKGGLREATTPEAAQTEDEKYQAAVRQIQDDTRQTFDILGSLTGRKAFQVLPEPELHLAIDTAEAFLKEAKAWAATPKNKRAVQFKLA